jgi:hypothetical protein
VETAFCLPFLTILSEAQRQTCLGYITIYGACNQAENLSRPETIINSRSSDLVPNAEFKVSCDQTRVLQTPPAWVPRNN